MPHVQIRNMPEAMHRELKARAARAGMSLSEYLLAELRETLRTLPMDDWLELVRSRERYDLDDEIVRIIREDRESH